MATPLLNEATHTLATPTLATLLQKGGTVKLHKENPITNLSPFFFIGWREPIFSLHLYKIICYLEWEWKLWICKIEFAAYTVIAVKVDEMGTLHSLIIDWEPLQEQSKSVGNRKVKQWRMIFEKEIPWLKELILQRNLLLFFVTFILFLIFVMACGSLCHMYMLNMHW